MQAAPPGSSTLPRPPVHPAPGSASGDAHTDSGDDSPRTRKKKKNLRAYVPLFTVPTHSSRCTLVPGPSEEVNFIRRRWLTPLDIPGASGHSCDSCRDKKLRCIYIPDVEPHICFECEKVRLLPPLAIACSSR